MHDLVIKRGRIVTPDGTIDVDVGVDDEKIAVIESGLSGEQEIDATGKLVFPGIIDAHTHMSLPVAGTKSSDDFYSGTIAAACGGVTSIIDFTVGSGKKTIPQDIRSRKEEASPAVVDYALHGEVIGWRPGDESEFREAVELGVTSFKFYTAYEESGRRSDNGILYSAFSALADLGVIALVHCEDQEIIFSELDQLDGQELGRMSSLSTTRPPICEALAILQVGYLAERANARLHIAHVSSALGLDVVARAKVRGVAISAETCPQYLLLTEKAYDREDGHLFSASPALRKCKDQDALWGALKTGELDIVATDHCPFTNSQKNWKGSFLDLPYGIPGVETLLPLVYSEGVAKGKLSVTDLLRLLSEGPAKTFGLYPQKGSLRIGADADIVIFDPDVQRSISVASLHMNTEFSPYEGVSVQGAVSETISRGKIVFCDGEFQGERGWGKFIPCHILHS